MVAFDRKRWGHRHKPAEGGPPQVSHADLGDLTTGDPHTQYVLDTDLSAYAPLLHGHPGVMVYNSAAITLTTGVAAFAAFDSELFDSDGFHEGVTNPSRLTVPTGLGGRYLIIASHRFANNATGLRFQSLYASGAALGVEDVRPAYAAQMITRVAHITALADGAYLQSSAYQDSGGNLNLTAAGSFFGMFRLGNL